MNHSSIRSLLLLAGLLLVVACNAGTQDTTTTVRHSDFDIEPATRNEVLQSYAVLQRWLADNGYNKLQSVQSIKEATTWSGNSSEFSEVYSKQLSPIFPKSFFTVTILDKASIQFFRVTLTSSVSGTKEEHVSQGSIVFTEEKSFQKDLRASRPAK